MNPTVSPSNCAVVIPCLNEAERIGQVVEGVRRHLDRVIVVDDGSIDTTAAAARQAGAETLRSPSRTGKGAALRRGWTHAHRAEFAWVLMLDGDGQHDPQDIPLFLNHARQTRADLIVGDRMRNCANMPWTRRWANRWMSRRLSRLTGSELPDSQCGFRLGRLEDLLAMPVQADHFEIESAMLVALLRAGRKVEFVPIRTIYGAGPSRIHPVIDTLRWFRWRMAQRSMPRPGQPGAPPWPRPAIKTGSMATPG